MNYITESAPCDAIKQQSLTGRLKDERDRLQERLDNINDVLNRLSDNQEVSQILDAVAKLGHLY